MQHFNIVLVSYSHNNAPVAFRDKIALDRDHILRFIEESNTNKSIIREIAIISTCNRTEFYFLIQETNRLMPWLAGQYRKIKNININADDAPEPVILVNQEAVTHLMGVAGGIESMMLGENQILTQVKSSYEILLSSKNQSTIMNRLFQEAIRAGKSIRTNTRLCKGSVSVSLAAVELARKIFSHFTNRRILLIGAGETSEMVALHFKELGVTQFTIANRGTKRRLALAEKYEAQAITLDEITDALVSADVVVAATKSPHFLINYDGCLDAMKARNYKPLLLVDISTPRNVDPSIAQIPQVFLYDIDNIHFVVAENLEKRRKEIPAAEKIISEISADFFAWYKTLEVVPTISKLHSYFNHIRNQELQKYFYKTSKKEFERMEELSKSIVGKLLHYPITDLRELNNGEDIDISKINALWELFRLHSFEEKSD